MHRYPKELLDEIANYLHLPQAIALSESFALKIAKEVGYTMCNTTEYDSKYKFKVPPKYGDLDTLIWLHQRESDLKFKCNRKDMDGAAANGHIDIIKWLHENRSEGCTTDAMDYAARSGHLEVIKWLHDNRREAARAGSLDVDCQDKARIFRAS